MKLYFDGYKLMLDKIHLCNCYSIERENYLVKKDLKYNIGFSRFSLVFELRGSFDFYNFQRIISFLENNKSEIFIELDEFPYIFIHHNDDLLFAMEKLKE